MWETFATLRDEERQMFKTIEVGAWYRIRGEGRSVIGKVLERHGNSYNYRYAGEKGRVRTGKVTRSAIMGRVGDHLIPDLEAAITPPKRRKTREPKAKIRLGDWHRFEYEGGTVAGVVYCIDDDNCTMFFLYQSVPTFVTVSHKKLGPIEEKLTTAFREQMAKNPKYLEEWVSTAGRVNKPAPLESTKKTAPSRNPSTTSRKRKSSKGQRRLFPE